MPIAQIMDLIIKGLGILSAAVAAGVEVAPAIQTLVNLAEGAKNGTVTDEQLAATEAMLDSLLADFNTDLPPE